MPRHLPSLFWTRMSLFVLAGFMLAGCQTAYYATLEQFGYHKRDLLVSRVQEARDSQEGAKEQFASALEKFSSVVQFDGGKLQEQYKLLKSELDKSEASADAVRNRINAVENVSKALFKEWESELDQYNNAKLRNASEQQLTLTRDRYTPLIAAMRRAETKIDPVLTAFRDQVLFLKHNLNAQAIASLQGELVTIESDIAALIKEMEASIAEADSFIKAIGTS